MGYYIRVLSTSANCIPVSTIQSAFDKEKSQATLCVEDGSPDNWSQILLKHADGEEIACIERNPVVSDSLGAEELKEFAEEIADCRPASAAKWLTEYFPKIRCIYAFQVLHGADHNDGWNILGKAKTAIWSCAPSLIQADHEGFTNEDGYHILWQYGDKTTGDWWMGVLHEGRWTHFQMDLGSPLHRQAFFDGQVPAGVTLA